LLGGGGDLKIWVDADAALVTAVRVDGGPDVTDQYIAEHAEPGDLVVTQDIPLAALLVPRKVVVRDPSLASSGGADQVASPGAARSCPDALLKQGP
jgi:hypothetical protein